MKPRWSDGITVRCRSIDDSSPRTAQSGGESPRRGGGPPLSVGPAGRAENLPRALQGRGPSPRTKRRERTRNPNFAPLSIVGVVLWILLTSIGPAIGAEPQGAMSREELVAALERAPGPSKGPEDAPVVLVEFSDFQCTYCRKFWQETLPRIEERYIRSGKVRFLYRHLAILGEASVLAAQAAACANDQGRFWGYHDALFRTSSPLAFTTARLKRYAGQSGLDERTFSACLDSGRHAERVEAETILGRALGANGTPAFLINGQLLIGAYPFEVFEQALNASLAAPRRGPGSRTK